MATTARDKAPSVNAAPGHWLEVLAVFLRLGLTSFGGPVAHLGYFRDEFVVRRRWLDDAATPISSRSASSCRGRLEPGRHRDRAVARAASSGPRRPGRLHAAVGDRAVLFAYGVERARRRAGPAGCTASRSLRSRSWRRPCSGMARTLAPDRARATLAVVAAVVVLAMPSAGARSAPSCSAAWRPCRCFAARRDRARHACRMPVSRPRRNWSLLVLFFVLLLGLPLLAAAIPSHALAVFDAFYRAGSLVFGGGHVVLPLLQARWFRPGWVSNDAFLAGYGAAQAVPGPLFTFAAYLGAVMGPQPNGWAGALHLSRRHLPAVLPAGHRRAAVLGAAAPTRRWRKPPCAASTPPWSGCCWPRSTSRSGPWASPVPPICAGDRGISAAVHVADAALARGHPQRRGRSIDRQPSDDCAACACRRSRMDAHASLLALAIRYVQDRVGGRRDKEDLDPAHDERECPANKENDMHRTMIAASTILLALATHAAAQDWPTRPITLVVPFAAGGGVDVSARIQAQHMGELLGQTIIVENIGAAAGMAGGQRVAKAAPDGYTFLIGNTGTHAYNQSALQEAALQCRDRFPAGRAGVGIAAHPGRPQGPAGEQSPGVHRLHQGERKQDAVRLGRRRLRHASALRAVQPGDRSQRHARALSRRRPGDAGSDRRPHRLHVRHHPERRGAGQGGHRQRHRRDGGEARADHPGSRHHRRAGPARASKRASGTPSSCRRERPIRSCASSTRR